MPAVDQAVRCRVPGAAEQLAEALVAAGRADQPTVEAACPSRGTTRADAEPLVREMLAAYGNPVPVYPTEDDAWAVAAVAFGGRRPTVRG